MLFSALNGRFDLVTTTIGEKTVLLCTQVAFIRNTQQSDNKLSDGRSAIYLWLSDGAWVFDVEQISADNAGYSFSTLLHAKDVFFFALYSQKGEHGGLDSLVFVHLKDQLQRIKSVLT
ncbi:hypothetical protein TraAM80_10016 [Trypanosoma rangeli]|uniref:Sialidase domain-containing protein n=1 Tax=Trypanosoma rangeli TaxID=5698 RepID=A0A3R7KKB1_TRYRA|nr:uncharacterized protein TraAM80_10016 [Trypanosoma rangeli]RNE96129.1 hypothetical protein TraAM80_10016 [Trypanosoma rangeli]|eukprot:RNE96129.1 hypothetical protein TraAM80_10016 [Trypanosoma rangeli]